MSLFVDIKKKYKGFTLDIQLDLEKGVCGLLGASGCGKSMTLRCISGIEKPDSGIIVVNGKTLFDSKKRINLPSRQRKVGLAFQQNALFPHMNVEENMLFGLPHVSRHERNLRVAESLQTMGIRELKDRYPGQLSGGQLQRIALARSLVSSPEILMLDEPFSALDAHIKSTLGHELSMVLSAFPETVLYVSHDMDEVYGICPQIAVIADGKVVEYGKREDLLLHPTTLAGARITGCKNISETIIRDKSTVFAKKWGIALTCPKVNMQNQDVFVCIRAHHVSMVSDDLLGRQENTFSAKVLFMSETRFEYTFGCSLMKEDGTYAEEIFYWLIEKSRMEHMLQADEKITLAILPEDVLLVR